MSNDTEIARVFMLAKARVVRGTRGRPIRTIVEQGHRKPVGKFASLKSGRAMPWASFAELYLMWISEADTAVRRFLSQPFRLELLVGQRTRPTVYFPSLERELEDGTIEIVQIKKGQAEIDQRYDRKTELMKKVCRAEGLKFCIVTEDQIEIDPLLRNAKSIKTDRFTMVNTLDVLRFVESLEKEGGKLAYGKATELLSDRGDRWDGQARAKLHAMIVRRVASIDVRRRITPETPVIQVQPVRPKVS